MALTPINVKPKQRGGGGGLFGKIAGTIAGGIAGAFGGPSTALKGAAVGGALGGAIGGAIDPAKVKQVRQVPLLESAAKLDPEVQLAQLTEAQREVAKSPEFDAPTAQSTMEAFEEAKRQLKRRLEIARG